MAAAPRGRGGRPASALGTFGRLVLYVGCGFGAGLLGGVLLEEPELLMGHLRGEGESVVLAGAESAGEGTPDEVEGASAAADTPQPAEASSDAEPSDAEPGDAIAATAARAEPPAARPDPSEDVRRRAMEAIARQERDRAGPAVPVAAAVDGDSRHEVAAAPPRAVVAAPAGSRWAIQVGAFTDDVAADRLVGALRAKGYPVERVPASGDRPERWRVRVQPVAGEQEARALAERLKRDERLPTWVLPMEARPGS